MMHYLNPETMAYTACRKVLDNGITKLETTDNVNQVTCEDCVDAILAMWEGVE